MPTQNDRAGTAATPEELIRRLTAAGEAFAGFIEGLPEEAFRRRPAGDAWSVAELAGHVAEFPATFAEQAAKLALTPGLALGRQLDDPGRLAAIARLEGAGPRQAAVMVRATVARAAHLLAPISPAGWEHTGTRVVNGETITARQLVERFVIGHIEAHVEQARATATAA